MTGSRAQCAGREEAMRGHRAPGILGPRTILCGVKFTDWDQDWLCSAIRIRDTADDIPCRTDALVQEFLDPSGNHRYRGKRDG
jgi:hypothetical protein